MGPSGRYDRQLPLLGAEGQRRLADAHLLVLGTGGLGMPLLQQAAYLGIPTFTAADPDALDETSLNRFIGGTPDDVGAKKVDIAQRLVAAINPNASFTALSVAFPDDAITVALQTATVVVGCFDLETPRVTATEMCSLAGVPYIDLASEVLAEEDPLVYGGRVVVATGLGCLDCLDVIDRHELARERMTPEQRVDHDRIYGIERDELGGSGPSVVTINSVVASLAATELMCLITGLRAPATQLTYRGDRGVVLRDNSEGAGSCVHCGRWRVAGLSAEK